jgi:tRNA G18 (ribose-2'-O)-methylase SpoU
LALKAKGYRIVAVEQVEGSIELQNFNWDKTTPIALVLGNETDGVDQSVLDVCDNCIEIPQFGTKHSFNVSVCTGILLWALCQ